MQNGLNGNGYLKTFMKFQTSCNWKDFYDPFMFLLNFEYLIYKNGSEQNCKKLSNYLAVRYAS